MLVGLCWPCFDGTRNEEAAEVREWWEAASFAVSASRLLFGLVERERGDQDATLAVRPGFFG